MLATDNFLEKYMPFKIQNIVSRNIKAIVPKIWDLKVQRDYWTEEQTRMYATYARFKEQEYEIYRELHKEVLKDNGLPALRKSAFSMPGYRKVIMNKDEIHGFEINNNLPN
jgi:hypothetical protein